MYKDKEILTSWQKIKQDTSLFYYILKVFQKIGYELELIGVPMAISPLHDSDKSNVEGQDYKRRIIM